EISGLLGRMLFSGEERMKPTATLSGGETVRLLLAKLMMDRPNVLVLDEPTNHLDLPAIEQLETALDSYEGTLLLVSHDRALLDAVRITRAVDARGAPADDWRR
ncbi:MAG TPA: ATP-binding cassette domain-containing protein, partial [Acidimicrobiia bacterium]|nr:ATP-binding cassette domain-containing protein [Acidimicrobiia bacterium]